MKRITSHSILVVCDLQDQRELLNSSLKLAGYDVLQATNATAAIRLATEQRSDLLITQFSSPIDAIELHRRIRSIPTLTETPILVISETDATHLFELLDETRDDLLHVPYEPVLLISRVARLVERKRSQDELRRSQQRYFELFHNANDIVYTHDLEGHYTSLNKRGQDITGYSSDELATLEFKNLATPEDVALAHGMLHKKLNGEAASTIYELSIKAKDGTIIPFEVNSQLIYENGRPVGVQGIARDIRARKEGEEKLRQVTESLLAAERRAITEYKVLLERIAQLAQILASARELDQIFTALLEFTTISLPCDALAIALYDHEQLELTPHFLWPDGTNTDLSTLEPFTVTTNSDIRRAILSAKTIIAASSPDQSIPRLLQDSDTTLSLSSAMIVPMTIMGRTIGILEIQSTDRDAYQTEHTVAVQMAANLAANTIENVRLLNREREQEAQLRQAQKMEAVGQLAGGVAHDFNNLVTAMYGNCDSLIRGLEQSNPLRRHVFEIKHSATRAATLTKQLLAFSRKQVLQPVTLNLNTVVTDMERLIARVIGEDISIICNLADDLPPIKADKSQLEQIVLNLTVNARDAMPMGGKITIETSLVYPDKKNPQRKTRTKNNPHVQLSISDNGIGMSAELQKHIFEPFFTTKKEGKGTGMGLATVWGCVKQSGGSIWLTSKEGEGSTFNIQFPITSDNYETVPEIGPEATEDFRGTQTILIAEDDPSVRQVLRDALSHSGYKILEAINGLDGYDVFKQHADHIQLVITDVLMPQMNGRDLALLITQLRSGVNVLFISGHPTDVITDRGVLLEGVNFLKKPFTGNDLLHAVRKILNPNGTVQPAMT